MAEVDLKAQVRKQKLHIKIYAGLCVVLLIAMGIYSYINWREYDVLNTAVEKNKIFISALRDSAADEKAAYESQKSKFDDLDKTIQQKLADIFPSSDSYTALVRQLDAFEEKLNTKNDPFEVSNLDFDDVQETDLYAILPLSMSIRSSGDNFQKFLHLVETSGSLDNQVRLMDIQSISLNFSSSGPATSKDQLISFNVQLNAYFQKP